MFCLALVAAAFVSQGAVAKVRHTHTAPAAPVLTCDQKLEAANAYAICGQECHATHDSGGGLYNTECPKACLARFCQN